MFLAHRRASAHVPVVSELLQWRLRDPESLPEDARDGYRQVIDQLVSATQLRHPAIGDLARQVQYRCFDAPLIARERARAQQQVRAELDNLSADPEARAAQIDAIVASGEPILGVFAERHHAVMLEVMTRRYYQIRPLQRVQAFERGGRPVLTAEYDHDGHDYMIIATVARGTDSAAGTDLRQLVDSLPANRTVLIDLYVTSETSEDEGGGPDARAGRIRDKLGIIPRTVGRVAVAVRRPDGTEGDEPAWFTFYGAPGSGEAVEDRTQRGLHPMVAERLGLWRLSAFELTRLPAAPDVHLFRVQGREVPDDQRLIALADVRDLTVLRDAGRPDPRPAADRAHPRRLPGQPALRPLRRPRPGEAGLEPRPALRLAGRGRTAHRPRPGRPVLRPAHRSARAGAGAGAVPDDRRRRPGRPAPRADAADVPPARRRADAAHHRPAVAAAERDGLLHAEGDPGPPPRRGIPLRARPADHPLARP